MTRYFYKDHERKIHFTHGEFVGWTEPTGLLDVPYAMFKRVSDILFIPVYDLTRETREVLPAPKGKRDERAAGTV